MKKFFEKHDLFKLVGIVAVIAVLLTWLVGGSVYSNGSLVTNEINRVGLFDFTAYSLLGISYFPLIFMFIFIVAGFYKFLGSLDAYDRLTSKIAAVFERKEKIFVGFVLLVFACYAGVTTEHVILFAIIPFVISILSKLKVDKLTGLMSTFGGVLVGVLGATYSSRITGILVSDKSGMGVSYGFEIIGTVVIFAIACLLLMYFVFNRMTKVKKFVAKEEEQAIAAYEKKNGKLDKDDAKRRDVVRTVGSGVISMPLLEDPFIKVKDEDTKKKKIKQNSSLGLGIILTITFVIILLAFIGWDTAFSVTIFADAFEWLSQATIGGQTIYKYILGGLMVKFGSWDLLTAAGLLLLASFIIKLIYHVPFDKMLDEYAAGFKKIGKSIVILMLIYFVLEVSYFYPTISFLVDKIVGISNNFFTLFLSGMLTSIFAVDFEYVVANVGSLYAAFSNVNIGALILQASYGVISFIAPTSVVLMLGLSYLDIKFKDYLRFIWKFLLALIVLVLIVIAILLYV